jgi:hypothetical protein
MLDGLDQTDQFTLICRELSMPWSDGLAEERHRSVALMQYHAKTGLEHITLDHKLPVERRQLENRRHGQGTLECTESGLGLQAPPESLFS